MPRAAATLAWWMCTSAGQPTLLKGLHKISCILRLADPGSTVESWQNQLQTLASFRPPHLSCYALTVEEKTVLHHQVKTGEISLPADDVIVKQFEVLDQWANAHGYAHYELSNFAQPGKHSRPNSHYWTGAPYLGIGPGAHSFDGTRRWWNISNNTLYSKGAKPTEEQLSPQDLLHERLMVRLRTAAGFSWDNDFPHELGRAERFVLEQGYKKWLVRQK